jgi:glyoxylase-like metal-dependent hydrolase (beta-lactamase superfamily II)
MINTEPTSRRVLLQSALGAGVVAGLSGVGVKNALGVEYRAENKTGDVIKANGQQGSGYYRFSVGDLSAVAIQDGAFAFSPLQPLFAPEATADELNTVLKEYHHPLDKAPAQINVLALGSKDSVTLIDTGLGGENGMIQNLEAAGIAQASVKRIIISHAHGDHIMGLLNADGSLRFPGAEVIISKSEKDFWSADTVDLGQTMGDDATKKAWVASAVKVINALGKNLRTVETGAKIDDNITTILTPGHTPGHMSLRVNSGNQGLFVTGDLAHNHVIMFARPAWTIGFDYDKKMAVKSREKAFDMIAADGMRVFGYHLPWPGLGRIRRESKGFQWISEPWQW